MRTPGTLVLIVFAYLAIYTICSSSRTIRVFSDTHVGSHWVEKPEFYKSFSNFLQEMADPATNVTEVVLNGDIFDLWLIPMEKPQHDLQELTKMEDKGGVNISHITELIKNVAQNIPVYYARGNHDMAILESDWKEVFGNLIPFYPDEVVIDGSQFMHGCQFDLFNSREYSISPEEHPVGYYISRAAADVGRPSSPPSSFVEFLCKDLLTKIAVEVLDPLLVKEVFSLTLDVIYDGAFQTTGIHKKYDDVIFNGGDFVVSDNPGNITFLEAFNHFVDLPKRWVDVIGKTPTAEMLPGACGAFEYFIERMPPEIDIIALGHSHGALIEWYKREDGTDILYVNSGAWVDDIVTYVDISYDYPNCPHPTWVRIYEYHGDHGEEREDEWFYAPNGDQLVSHTVISAPYYSFNRGPEIACPAKCEEGTWDRVNMYTLAMLEKAKVLSVSASRRTSEDLEWYGKYYSLTDESVGKLRLEIAPSDETFKIFVFDQVPQTEKSLFQLIQWWTTKGYKEYIGKYY